VQAFAAGLVQGGYATDPDYASKLVRVAGQIRAQGY
jgi:flagellar protein FlgJ